MPTFLFTDIEGSTQLWEKYPRSMNEILNLHDKIITEIIQKYGGEIIKYMGDGVFAVFENSDPLGCVVEIQKQIYELDCRPLDELKVRIALNSGEADIRDGDYFGRSVSITSKLLDAGWGGQIILTEDVLERHNPPSDCEVVDYHLQRLEDFGEPLHIYGLTHPDLPYKEFPPLKTLNVKPHNLPDYSTKFIGRAEEIKEIEEMLREPSVQLITIHGLGGIGKTRLACKVATEIIQEFKDGVYFIPLASVDRPHQIITTLGNVINFPFEGSKDPGIQLMNYLKDKELLLILDNFEHLIEGTDIIEEILTESSKVKLLVTSRQKLYLGGENIYQLKGMAIPDDASSDDFYKYSAIKLFIEGGRRVRPDLTIEVEDRTPVKEICSRVEGIPLGIELASAWLSILTLEEILDEIEESIDRLESTREGIPERHKSIKAMFEYSWKLFSGEEQKVARKLSVFRGGFSRREANAITGASTSQLSALLDKSMIKRTQKGSFQIHELVSEYLDEKIEQHPEEKLDTEHKHSSYFSEYIENLIDELKSAKQIKAIKQLRERIENIRKGFNISSNSGNPDNLDRYVSGLLLYYDMTSQYYEGMEVFKNSYDILNECKTKRGSDSRELSRTLAGIYIRYSWFSFLALNRETDTGILNDCISIFKEDEMESELALSFNYKGLSLKNSGDYDKADELHKKSISIYSNTGDTYWKAKSLIYQGHCKREIGDFINSRDIFIEASELFEQIGNQSGKADALVTLGGIYISLNEFEKAKEMFEKSLHTYTKINDKRGISACYTNLGGMYYYLKDIPEAIKASEKSLAIKREMGNPYRLALNIGNLGYIYNEDKNYEKQWSYLKKVTNYQKK